ncbi:MAG TPA: type II secretion system protein [Stellaceae bacterium]|nr:type II secretion system protein [Stellaceae bacterium]
MRGRRDDSGFTLIEVLVAFAIAAVLLLPLLRSFSTGIGTATRTDATSEATLIAQSTLEGMGHFVALSDGASIDRQEGPYRVSASVRRYEGDGAAAGPTLAVVPYDVSVTVDWQEGARIRSITLHTLRLGSPPAKDQNP